MGFWYLSYSRQEKIKVCKDFCKEVEKYWDEECEKNPHQTQCLYSMGEENCIKVCIDEGLWKGHKILMEEEDKD